MNEQIQIIRRITAAAPLHTNGYRDLQVSMYWAWIIISHYLSLFLHIVLRWYKYQLYTYRTYQCKMTQWHDKFHALSKFCNQNQWVAISQTEGHNASAILWPKFPHSPGRRVWSSILCYRKVQLVRHHNGMRMTIVSFTSVQQGTLNNSCLKKDDSCTMSYPLAIASVIYHYTMCHPLSSGSKFWPGRLVAIGSTHALYIYIYITCINFIYVIYVYM